MSFSTSSYDFLDVIDLESVLKMESGAGSQEKKAKSFIRSGTPGKYISLESISDDELHLITRSLITPVSFQYDVEHTIDGHPLPCRHGNRPRTSWQRNKILEENDQANQALTYRSESAAIFDRLNNDDDISVDFAASDLQDFIDPVLLEGVISRPVSRVPNNDRFSHDHEPSGKNPPLKYDLPSSIDYTQDNEIHARAENKYKQHINSMTSSNNYSKRHSMDAEVLMALRRDSDALLQRRESLLRLRKFSEGIASPKSTNKNINRRPMAPTSTYLPSVTQSKHTPLIDMNSQYDSLHDKATAPQLDDKYGTSVADINSAFKSTTIRDENYLKRVRSVSFPHQSQNSKEFSSTSYTDDLVPHVSPSYYNDQAKKATLPSSGTKYNELQYPAYSQMTKDKRRISVRNDHPIGANEIPTQFLPRGKKSTSNSAEQDNDDSRFINKGRQIEQHFDFGRTDGRQNQKSVTESAKTLLASVRQRRTDNRKEAYNQRSSSLSIPTYSTSASANKQKLAEIQSSSSYSNSTTRNYTHLPKKNTDGDKIHTTRIQTFHGEVSNDRYSTGQPRRLSSSLPLSSSFYGAQTNLGYQNEGGSRGNKIKQTEKKYNYVAKKSALDKSKDRYVALLGKPPSSK